mgnify:FL=1
MKNTEENKERRKSGIVVKLQEVVQRLDTCLVSLYNKSVNHYEAMTLTSKFKKDISTLRAAANKEIFLDVKYPKLYKKLVRFYQNEVNLTGEDPDADYNAIMECIAEDLVGV